MLIYSVDLHSYSEEKLIFQGWCLVSIFEKHCWSQIKSYKTVVLMYGPICLYTMQLLYDFCLCCRVEYLFHTRKISYLPMCKSCLVFIILCFCYVQCAEFILCLSLNCLFVLGIRFSKTKSIYFIVFYLCKEKTGILLKYSFVH